MISKVTIPVIFYKDTTSYLSSLDLNVRMKCLVCPIISFLSSARSQVALFDSHGGSGEAQNNPFHCTPLILSLPKCCPQHQADCYAATAIV